MRLLTHLLPGTGIIVVFLMAACSNVEPSATPGIAATAEAMVNEKLAAIIPTPTTQPQLTVAGLPRTPTLAPTPAPTSLPLPTPTLTIREIFDFLDRGILTTEEAAAELKRRDQETLGEGTQPPAATAPTSPTVLPASTPASADARGSAQWISLLESQIHELVNQERRKASLSNLEDDSALAEVARSHSQDMAINDFFNHENLYGQSPSERADAAGYSCVNQGYIGVAENIFTGWQFSAIITFQSTSTKAYFDLDELAKVVVDGWMNSPGHRRNILTERYNKEGIGVGVNPETEAVLVTQNFC